MDERTMRMGRVLRTYRPSSLACTCCGSDENTWTVVIESDKGKRQAFICFDCDEREQERRR